MIKSDNKMIDTNLITIDTLQKYYNDKDLGRLTADAPVFDAEFFINLDIFFRSIIGLKMYEPAINPQNIESVCIYGSVLYKHFPPKIEEKVTKFLGFVINKEKRKVQDYPNDFDIAVILKEGISPDKVIITKRHESDSSDIVLPSGARKKLPIFNEIALMYGRLIPIDSEEGNMPLHIAYRSIEQFLNGIKQGDELSQSIYNYGLPIVGQTIFNEIIKPVFGNRNPLHTVQWYETPEGKFSATVN